MTTYVLTETVFSAYDSLKAGTRVSVEGELSGGIPVGYVDVTEVAPPHRTIKQVAAKKLRVPMPVLPKVAPTRQKPAGGWVG